MAMATDPAEARALHDEVCAVDLHADTPKLMVAFGYDLALRHEPPLPRASYLGHVDVPRMREGGLGAQVFGLWTFPYPRAGCAASVHAQLDALDRAVAAAPDDLAWAGPRTELEDVRARGRLGVLAGIEGGQALEGKLERVEEFARRGVRYLGLLHFSANDLGRPAMGVGRNHAEGLTSFGRAVVEEMERVGMIVDLSHVNRRGFFDALDVSRTPPIVSHTGVAGVRRHWRNVDDEQLRAVADRGGVVGIIFAPRYLGADGIDAVCEHIEHVIRIAGEDAVALGSDYDGMIRPSKGLEDISRLPALTARLLDRGATRAAVRKLLGENVLRVLGAVPPRVPRRPVVDDRADRG